MLQAAGVGAGLGWYTTSIIFIGTTTFFFSTWETYYTGCLYLGYMNGPTEGLLIAVISLIISGIYGPKFWWQPISKLVPFLQLPKYLSTIKLVELCIGSMAAMMVFTQIPVSILRVREAAKRRRRPFNLAALRIIPFVVINLAIYFWLIAPGSKSGSKHLLLFISLWGIAFGRIAVNA